ncbi:MAG: alanine racemase, partial [Desulfobacterales bacterium]|nr:alanine racemase [Desulfobacterales bacterium]
MALGIENNYRRIRHEIDNTARSCHRDPDRIRLIAVSKRKSAELIQQALDGGARDFGENYIQEAVKKIDLIGKDAACWHFIGHLQSNKARFAVQYFDYIHTVDSL